MAINFNYKNIKRPDGSTVKTPSIPVVLKGKERVDVIALLDSGADISAISKDMAELLELNLTGKRDYSFGVGGKVQSVDSTMEIMIEKGHERYNFRIPVKVILDNYDLPVLLGRAGFFDKFIICFDQACEKITLKRALSKKF